MSAREDEERDRSERQIERVLEEAGKDTGTTGEEPVNPDIPPDRTRNFSSRTASLSRMRMSWAPEDEIAMMEIRRKAGQVIREEFAPAFEIMDAVYSRVRFPEADEKTGEILRDPDGEIRWKKGVTGRPLEDWSLLGHSDRESFLDRSISVIWELEQRAADLWGEAMFAKAAWEQAFAVSYDAPDGRRTVEDRTSLGRLGSMEERYFGIFRSWLSRRADAVVSTIRLLNQRMKDSMD